MAHITETRRKQESGDVSVWSGKYWLISILLLGGLLWSYWPTIVGLLGDWKNDDKACEVYYDRLWNFVSKLPPSFNSLKANVLYRRLRLDRRRGIYDKDRFMEYVKLPRPMHYVERKYLERMSKMNMTLEIELGVTGGEEDGVDNTSLDNARLYTQPEEVAYAYQELIKVSDRFTIAAAGSCRTWW